MTTEISDGADPQSKNRGSKVVQDSLVLLEQGSKLCLNKLKQDYPSR